MSMTVKRKEEVNFATSVSPERDLPFNSFQNSNFVCGISSSVNNSSSGNNSEVNSGNNSDNELDSDTQSNTPNEKNKYKLITKRIDSNRIRHKCRKEIEVFTSLLKDMKTDIDKESPFRSGAIIYTHHKGKTYFCLGVDSCYGDLTDFAGGVKKEENIVDGGLRELKEESQGVFGDLSYEDVKECLTIYTNNMMIIFIRRDIDMDKIKRDFNYKVSSRSRPSLNSSDDIEVSNVIWLESKEFLEAISGKGRRMYVRIKKLLSKVTHILQAL
jgi:hypothetical protein